MTRNPDEIFFKWTNHHSYNIGTTYSYDTLSSYIQGPSINIIYSPFKDVTQPVINSPYSSPTWTFNGVKGYRLEILDSNDIILY